MKKHFVDLAIVGAGVNGSALYYSICKYRRKCSVLLLDKKSNIAMGNTRALANSQTLHAGDIETNYSYDDAVNLRESALTLRQYCLSLKNRNEIIFKMPKMVLAVGEQEINFLQKRYQTFLQGFPRLQWFDRQKLRQIEPQVALKQGSPRKKLIAAMGYEDCYAAINYGLLTESFVEQAHQFAKENSIKNSIWLSSNLLNLEKNDHGYLMTINRQGHLEQVQCRYLVASCGSYSLKFAQQCHLGLEYSLLSAAGNFYYSALPLRGKVYTIQQPKLPFAAIHGDLDIAIDGRTRLGPTMALIAQMERGDYKSLWDYCKLVKIQSKLPKALFNLFSNPVVRKNLSYVIPLFGKYLFLKQSQKIIPDLRLRHLTVAKKVGGARPLLVNHHSGQLVFGETKLSNESATFNVAPATGASTCLNVAFKDLQKVTSALNLKGEKLEDISSLSA